ncbi:hypothetical protein D917_08495 [Trichinella nativa]|uniref:WD repeat domain phosphoinositide-interacting protein 3 n=1 Tax=Trichinella nativa TaxID=6335 RepID=A0A1Y3EJX7_9BILA|nr:hypothetical protein D917_08495 [Trichinella nativa]
MVVLHVEQAVDTEYIILIHSMKRNDMGISDFFNGIGHVAMLYKYNYLGLVGGGLNPQDVVIRISDLPSRVCGVRLRRDRIVVILEQMIKVYPFSVELELLVEFETAPNSNGLCCLMGHADRALMAFPAKQPGVVRTVDLADPTISLEIPAHESPLACMAFNNDGTLLATASEKNGLKLHEFRRGTNPAVIYSISFNVDSTLLCVGSGHGTVHVFSLSGSSITYPKIGIFVLGNRSIGQGKCVQHRKEKIVCIEVDLILIMLY